MSYKDRDSSHLDLVAHLELHNSDIILLDRSVYLCLYIFLFSQRTCCILFSTSLISRIPQLSELRRLLLLVLFIFMVCF